MAGLCAPLSTLRRCPREHLRMTRGRCGSLLLHRDGLAPSTPCRSPGALRFTPESGLNSDIAPCPFRANNGSRQFSITSFAWGEQFAGTLRQIALRNQYMHADEIKIVNIST